MPKTMLKQQLVLTVRGRKVAALYINLLMIAADFRDGEHVNSCWMHPQIIVLPSRSFGVFLLPRGSETFISATVSWVTPSFQVQ